MNHQQLYNNIINKAKSENRKKLKKTDERYVYYENHHIIPKCLNGSDDKENLMLLTAKEHYVCHKLLTYIYKGNRKIANTFHYMTFDKKGKHIISSKDYAYAKELKANIPISEETRKKMSNSKKGKQPWNKGLKFTEDSKIKMSNSHKGKKYSDDRNKKISIKMKGVKKTEKTKEKMKNSQKGKILSESHKEKLRLANLGKTSPRKGIILSDEIKQKISNTLKNKHKTLQ